MEKHSGPFKFEVGEKILIIDAQKSVKDMMDQIGRVFAIKERKKDCNYDSMITNGYRLVGFPYSWVEEWLAKCEERNFSVTEDDFADLFG